MESEPSSKRLLLRNRQFISRHLKLGNQHPDIGLFFFFLIINDVMLHIYEASSSVPLDTSVLQRALMFGDTPF